MDEARLRRRLLWHGVFLFLLGLLTGFAIGATKNPRMGLTSHLEGVMNGMFLGILGLAWHDLRLTRSVQLTAYWLALAGTYLNWGSTLIAAIFGTMALAPIAGSGQAAAAWQEGLVTFGLLAVSVAMPAVCLILLWGLRGDPRDA